MKRVLNAETIKYLCKSIKVCGWVNIRRDHGGIAFGLDRFLTLVSEK